MSYDDYSSSWRLRKACGVVGHGKLELGIFIQRSGVRRAVQYCVLCGHTFDCGVKLPADNAHLPVVRDNRNSDDVCAICDAVGAELHHWAPRALFGFDEAERWPTSLLCPEHHREWHQVMNAARRKAS